MNIVQLITINMSFYKKMHLFLERHILWWDEHCSVDHNQYVVLQEDASLFRTSHYETNIQLTTINMSFYKKMHLFLERHILWWDEHCSVDHNQYVVLQEDASLFRTSHIVMRWTLFSWSQSICSERHILWWDEHCSVDHNQYVVLQEDASLFRTSHIVMRWTLFSWSQSICRSTRRCISF